MRKFAALALITLWPLALVAGENTIVMKDGTQFSGRFLSGTTRVITFQDDNGDRHALNIRDIQSITFAPPAYANNVPPQYNGSTDPNSPNYNPNPPAYNGNPNPPASQVPFTRNTQRSANGDYVNAAPPPPANGNYSGNAYQTLPANTEIAVRTVDAVDSRNTTDGRSYAATIDRDVLDASGNVVLPRGADAQLVVKDVNGGGIIGSSNLILDLQSVTVNGQRFLVNTQDLRQTSNDGSGIGKNKRTGEIVGGGAVLGTLLGAIGGGGKGALIGAIAGAAAGAGVQVLTRGREVRVPSETILNFRLDRPMQLQPSN